MVQHLTKHPNKSLIENRNTNHNLFLICRINNEKTHCQHAKFKTWNNRTTNNFAVNKYALLNKMDDLDYIEWLKRLQFLYQHVRNKYTFGKQDSDIQYPLVIQ